MSDFDRIEEHRADHGTVRIYVTQGRKYTHHECQRRLKAAVNATARWFHRSISTMTKWNDAEMNTWEIRELRWVLGDMANYVEVVQRELDRLEGVNRVNERILALRAVEGRTPEEAALYLAKADALAARHG